MLSTGNALNKKIVLAPEPILKVRLRNKKEMKILARHDPVSYIKQNGYDGHFAVITGRKNSVNKYLLIFKGLNLQAFGYKDMLYFRLKILQKCGYLNTRFALINS